MCDARSAEERQKESELIARFSEAVVRRGLTTPAILFLEMHRPLSFVTAQAMTVFGPMATLIFDPKDYEAFARLLERRGAIEDIIRAIEAREAERTEAPAGEATPPDDAPGRDETEAA